MAPSSPPIAISAADLRRRFATGRYVERAIRDGYTCCLRSDAACVVAGEPASTRSLMIGFLNPQGWFAFLVHFYLRPNGDVGASGLLDPKYLVAADGNHYYVP